MDIQTISEKTRFFLSNHLSASQKRVARLFSGMIVSPRKFRKHLNLYQYEKSLLNCSELAYIPPVFGATVTEQCNLRCPTCLYLLENKDKFHSATISPEKFRAILEKINPDKKADVLFITGGEPLLHPQIGELISITISQGMIPRMSTNGILIAKKIDELADIDYINVSLDSYDYDTFLRYRGGTPHQFDLIRKGISLLIDRRMNFSVSFVLSSTNVHEVKNMIALAEELGVPAVYFHNINPHGCEDYKPLTLQDPATRQFLKEITQRNDYPFDIHISAIFDLHSEQFKKARCIQPWYYFCFNTDGDIAYCCHLSHSPEIGNVSDPDCLNTPALVDFRKSTMMGRIPASCLYCQRRFMDAEFGRFNAELKTWFIHKDYSGAFDQ